MLRLSALIAISLMFAECALSQESEQSAPAENEAPGTLSDGFGFGGAGEFGGVAMGIPESAIPGRKWIAGDAVIVAFSDDGKQVSAYSEQHPRWVSQDLDQVPGCEAIPVVGDLVAVRNGHYCYAYSPTLGTWEVLKLPVGEAAVPVIGTDGIRIHSASQGDYVFKSSWGKWFSAEEIKAGRVAEYLLAQRGSEQAGQPVLAEVKVFRLELADATDVARIVQQLLASRGRNMSLAADARTNSLLVNAEEELVREVETLIKVLDAPDKVTNQVDQPGTGMDRYPKPSAPASSDSREHGETFSFSFGKAKESVGDLRENVSQFEQRTRELAIRLRDPSSMPGAAGKVIEEQLRATVRQSFEARQKLQRAELAEFARRLQGIQQSIQMRDRIAQQIIDRRVEEVLDPNVKWNANESLEPLPMAERSEAPTPTAIPGNESHSSFTPVDGTSRKGIFLTVPLDAETYPAEMIQQNLGRLGIKIVAASNLIGSVLADLCRLESVSEIQHRGRKHWSATLFVPQGPYAHGSNNSVTQQSIDDMAASGTTFQLHHHTWQLSNATGNIDTVQAAPPEIALIPNHKHGHLEWLTKSGTWISIGAETLMLVPIGSQQKLRWSGIPDRGDAVVFINVVIPAADPDTFDVLFHNPVPLALTSGGTLDPLFNGDRLTKVHYLPHDLTDASGSLYKTVSSFNLPPDADTATEAKKLGIVAAVMRFSLDAEDASTAKELDPNAEGKVFYPELQGTWEAVELKTTEKSPVLSSFVEDRGLMIIRGNLMIHKSVNRPESEMRFTCDCTTTPQKLTMFKVRDGKEYIHRSIVEVSGDTLRRGTSLNGSSQFPESFDAPRTIIQVYRRVAETESAVTPPHPAVDGEAQPPPPALDSPQAVLKLMYEYGERQDYAGYISLLTDDEAQQMAGMLLRSATVLVVMAELSSRLAEQAGDPAQVYSNRFSPIINRFRKEAPPETALVAYGELVKHSFPDRLRQAQGNAQRIPHPTWTAKGYAAQLRSAAGILTETRKFCAEMMTAMSALETSPKAESKMPQWQIEVSNDEAVATSDLEASEPNGKMNPSVVRLRRMDGRWRISSLMSDEQMLEFANGPVITEVKDPAPIEKASDSATDVPDQ